MKAALKQVLANSLSFRITEVTPGERVLMFKRSHVDASLEMRDAIGMIEVASEGMELLVSFEQYGSLDVRELVFACLSTEGQMRFALPDIGAMDMTPRVLISGPQKPLAQQASRVAALTIAFNEDFILAKWCQHYGEMLGYEHLYVIDDGSDVNPREYLSSAVNVFRQPRTHFDSWRLCRSLSQMQRLLLETYDVVLVLDSDEFLVTGRNDCDNALEHIASIYPFADGRLRPLGWELIHCRSREGDLDAERPIVEQRGYLLRADMFDKPCVTREDISLFPGNHHCYESSCRDESLHLIHMRWFDLRFAIAKGLRYSKTSWSTLDLAMGLSFHQRMTAQEIESKMNEYEQQALLEPMVLPESWRKQIAV